MPVGKIKSRKVGDLKKLKERNKRSAGDFLLYVKPDSELTVRILDEPEDWTEFYQHYMEDMEPRTFACNEGDCQGCDAGNKPSLKWAAAVIDVAEKRARVWVFPKTVQEKLVRKHDKYHTILDRDYTITRIGSGKFDTEYEVEAQPRMRRDLTKYESQIQDPEEILAAQIPVEDDTEEEAPWDDEKPRRRKKSAARPPAKKTAGRRRPAPDDDDEEDEAPRRRPTKRLAPPKKAKGRPLRRA